MRKLKSFFSVLLALCLLVTTCTVAFAEETGTPEEASTKLAVNIRANTVRTNLTTPDESTVLLWDFIAEIDPGKTLAESGYNITHDSEHTAFLDGWFIYQDLGNEGMDPILDENNDPKLFTTDEILNFEITTTTSFEAIWKGKYTSLAWLTLNPNGGLFDRSYTADGSTYNDLNIDYDSCPAETAGESFKDLGFVSISDPRCNGKTFEGWVAYYHGPKEHGFSGPIDGTLLTSDQVLEYANAGIGYTDFIAKWQGEDIVSGNSGEGGSAGSPATPQPFTNIIVDGNFGAYNITYTEDGELVTNNDIHGNDFNIYPQESLKDIGVEKISDPVYWDGKRVFLGWMVFGYYPVTDEYGYTYLEYGPLEDKLLTGEEILTYPAEEETITFQAKWEGDDSDYTTTVRFDGVGGSFELTWNPDDPSDPTITEYQIGYICPENGKSFAEQDVFVIVSDPVREGHTFEGWLAIPEDAPARYEYADTLYTTKQIMTELPIPTGNVIYKAKWKEISFDDYRYSDPLFVDHVAVDYNLLHFVGNGGMITMKFDAIETPVQKSGQEVDAYNGKTFLEGLEAYNLGYQSLTVEKDKATFNGWDVYEFDKMYSVLLPEGQTITDDDYTILRYDETSFDEEDSRLIEYLLVKNPTVYKKGLTAEEVLNLKGKDLIAVANWSDWVDVTVEGSDEKYMLEVKTNDIIIPKAAEEKYETVEKAQEAMQQAAFTVETLNKDKAETVYYEITLKVQKDDGTWETVTPENFPKEGLKVTIPYNGLDPEKLDFVVTHLISSGEKAGEIEVLEHKEGKDGLEITVNSLSPFAVTYQNEEDAIPEATATPAPEKNPNDVPPTGDNNAPLFFLVLMTTAAAALFLTVKKLRKA